MKELNQTQLQEVAGGAYISDMFLAGAGKSIAGHTNAGTIVFSMPAELVLDEMDAGKGFI